MATTVATIGTSVVEYGNHSTPDRRALAAVDAAAVRLQHVSLLQAAVGNTNISSSNDSTRLFLQGPRSSGRSSLAMDMAYATAAATPCRQHCESLSSCRCVAVTIFVPIATQSEDEDFFPLYCQEIVSNNSNNNTIEPFSFQVQVQQLEQSKHSHSNKSGWSPAVLGRIQVRHVSTAREILLYLLTLQGKPVAEQPWGGIVVDSLDLLCSGSAGGTTASPAPLAAVDPGMLLSQVVAILLDTVHCLERIHGESCRPALAVTAANNISTRLSSVLSALVPQQLSLAASASTSLRSWQGLTSPEEAVVSTWTVSTSNTYIDALVEYAMVRGLDGSLRIVWTHPSAGKARA